MVKGIMKGGSSTSRIIDLTEGACLDDDLLLDDEVLHQLEIRGFSADLTLSEAKRALAEWDEQFSSQNIRQHYQAGRWSDVQQLVDYRLKVFPTENESHLHRIRAHYMARNWLQCIEGCHGLLKFEENNITAFRFIARSSKNLGNVDVAMEYYNQIMELSPTDEDSHVALIRMYYNKKSHDKVRQIAWDLIKLNPTIRDAHLFVVRSSMELGDHPSSLTSLQALLEIDSDDIEAVVEMGRVRFMLNQPEKARIFLERAMALKPGERRAQRTLSLVYDRLKEWDLALDLFIKECEIDPTMFTNWEKRINILYRMNREDDAKACLDHLFVLMGDTMETYLMAFLISTSFYWSEADSLHEKATNRWGGNIEFHTSITSHSLDVGDFTKALIHLQDGLRIKSDWPDLLALQVRMNAMLEATDTPIEEVEKSIISGVNLLQSECAIRYLSEATSQVKVRTPRATNLRVAMISSSLGRGGAERQVVSCLAGLVNQDSIGKLDLFCYNFDNTGGRLQTYVPEVEDIGIPIHQFGQRYDWNEKYSEHLHLLAPWKQYFDQLPPRILREVESLFLAFKINKPDIVHAWQDQTNVNVALAALMAGVPGIVMFARSLRPDGKTMLHIRNRPYLRHSYHHLLKHPRLLLCHNSYAGAQSYAEWLNEDANRFPVIHNGVDFSSIEEASKGVDLTETLNEIGIPKDAKIIGSVFRFVQEKQPRLWVETVAKVIEKKPNVHAVIVGGGGLLNATQSYIDELGLTENIHLIGQTREVKAWLDVFDLFLLTSRVEGLPNVLMEAQAFGVPVISTNAGGSADTFIDQETGILISDHSSTVLSEAILGRLDDESWMAAAPDLGRDFARGKFSPEVMIERLMQIYDLSLTSQST